MLMVSINIYYNNNIFLCFNNIDIKSGFNYNSDDTEEINIGLNNNSNIKKRNIKTNEFI